MPTNNPYRAFVDGFARLLTEGEALGPVQLIPPHRFLRRAQGVDFRPSPG